MNDIAIDDLKKLILNSISYKKTTKSPIYEYTMHISKDFNDFDKELFEQYVQDMILFDDRKEIIKCCYPIILNNAAYFMLFSKIVFYWLDCPLLEINLEKSLDDENKDNDNNNNENYNDENNNVFANYCILTVSINKFQEELLKYQNIGNLNKNIIIGTVALLATSALGFVGLSFMNKNKSKNIKMR